MFSRHNDVLTRVSTIVLGGMSLINDATAYPPTLIKFGTGRGDRRGQPSV